MKRIPLISVASRTATSLLLLVEIASPAFAEEAAPAKWVNEVQTYCMVPLLPEHAAELNVTVNGIWGGMGDIYPILTASEVVPAVQKKYGSDEKAFCADIHAAGQYAVATINGLEGFSTLRPVIPNMEAMACRGPDGKPVQFDDGMMLMCVNNPDWVAWELEFGKRGIDSGADLVLLDTPMSASFISGMINAGLCDHCMARFKEHLQAKFSREELVSRFGVEDFNRKEIVERLSRMQMPANPEGRPFVETSSDALLFQEFIHSQDQSGFDTRKQLLDDLRQYAASQGHDVVITANCGNMGTVNPGGHWVRAIMFADLVDIFTREQNYSPSGEGLQEMLPYPRGKLAPFHLLAYSIHQLRAPTCIPAGTMGALQEAVLEKDMRISTWMGVQCAEAYAANGAYIQYHTEPIPTDAPILQRLIRGTIHKKLLGIWEQSAEYSRFVLTHKDIYEGILRSGSETAILFQTNE